MQREIAKFGTLATNRRRRKMPAVCCQKNECRPDFAEPRISVRPVLLPPSLPTPSHKPSLCVRNACRPLALYLHLVPGRTPCAPSSDYHGRPCVPRAFIILHSPHHLPAEHLCYTRWRAALQQSQPPPALQRELSRTPSTNPPRARLALGVGGYVPTRCSR